jgi:hypothetical protein
MNGITRFLFPILFPSLVLLSLPSDAQAGFQWLDSWQSSGSGYRYVLNGIDLPDGTIQVQAYTEATGGFLGSNPPRDVDFSSSVLGYRKFALSGSPGGWDVDLDLISRQWFRFTVHMYLFAGMNIEITPNLPGSLPIEMSLRFSSPPPVHKTVHLNDGEYWVQFGFRGSLSFVPPLWQGPDFYVYHGEYSIRTETSLKATAVPEPASWLMIGPGLFAIAAFTFVSKRRKPGSGRPGSEETSGILDGFETSGIEGVRS